MAFLSPPPLRVLKPTNHAFPITCSRRVYRKYPSRISLVSAVAAAAISLPMISDEREGPHPVYRKLVPAAATAAVASSLLLRRRQKSSRTIIPKHSPDMDNIEARMQNERQDATGSRSSKNLNIYDRSREDWSASESQFTERSPSVTQHEATQSPPISKYSYPANSYGEAYNTTPEEFKTNQNIRHQPAVGMDTVSLFSHMRAEFMSENPSEQEDSKPQASDLPREREAGYESIVRPTTSDRPGKEKSQSSLLQHPSSISATDVLRWFVRVPTFIVSDIIVPVAQVSSIMWYDCKQWILRAKNQGERLYFMEDIQQTASEFNSFENSSATSWDWDELDVELTDEEKLLNEIQDNMRTLFGHAYHTVHRLFK